VVSLRDLIGRELPTSGITWTSSDLGVASVSGTGLVTVLGAGPVVVAAHAGTLVAQTLITVVPGEPTQLSIATQPAAAGTSGMAIDRQPVVELHDAGGNVAEMAGVEVTAVLAEGQGTLSNATATTDASGRATFTSLTISGASGDYRLRFEAAGLTPAISDVITLSAIPSALLIITQPSATAQSGLAFARQPSVEVRDSSDDPIVGAVVTAAIASGGGALGGTATATTNASGRATFTNLSISGLVGVRTLLFTSGSATATSSGIQLEAGALAQLLITQQPSSNATNDVAFPQQPVVRAYDGAGNAIGSLTVTAALHSGGGSLGGTTTIATSGSGDATFTNLKITGTVGPRTLRFSSGGLDATSSTVSLSAGAPVSVSIVTQPPSSAIDGVSFQQLPQIELRDVSDNPVPGADVVASVASGGGTASGTTTVPTSGAGTATFSNLSISGSPGPRTLRFSANGEEAISSTVHVGYAEGAYIDLQYCGSIAAQRMDVYIPSNSVQRPLPVAVYIHGGSWTGHDKSEEDLLLWANTRQELLARGFVVATLNYRLATPDDNKWPAQIHDVKCAIRHLRAEAGDYGADGRIGVWGASAGGHLAAMVGVADASAAPHLEGNEGYAGWSSRVSAAVSIGGISDLTQGPDHPEILFDGGEWAFTSWPGPDAELNHASPLWWPSFDDAAFLIVHGDQDGTVLYPQAPRLDAALDGAGANSTLVTVVNGGHELQSVGGTASPSIPEVMDQIADFFDTHVR
jgi:acetyl esterase/lipase